MYMVPWNFCYQQAPPLCPKKVTCDIKEFSFHIPQGGEGRGGGLRSQGDQVDYSRPGRHDNRTKKTI